MTTKKTNKINKSGFGLKPLYFFTFKNFLFSIKYSFDWW
ncbi:hypothetical protein HMPREF1253_1740 [Peptoniphilus sp. BV3C26]|nr:hypothetical protein HMPREF1253_1740 [Peptoniphilus sp. BV3C26]